MLSRYLLLCAWQMKSDVWTGPYENRTFDNRTKTFEFVFWKFRRNFPHKVCKQKHFIQILKGKGGAFLFGWHETHKKVSTNFTLYCWTWLEIEG